MTIAKLAIVTTSWIWSGRIGSLLVLAWTPASMCPNLQDRPVSPTPLSSRLDLQLTSSLNNNNVVLTPSLDNPTAFDSFKVGSPRVHRYSRQAEDSETEYVMWYHGRSLELQEKDPLLPPLSTGRVGRASSRNGLVWIKDSQGSASEDVRDVCLGLNKENWWGFDTAHVGLGNVLLPMSTPAVLSDGVYLCYYMGGSEETSITDYYTSEQIKGLPDMLRTKKVKGMKLRIGVAVSQDGMTWGRVEGDDPSGACVVPYDASDPNQNTNLAREELEEELYCGWPEVALNHDLSDSNRAFVMYYSTMTKADKIKCIAQAVSPDGFRWIKTGIRIRPSPESLDGAGCARCCVLRDATFEDGKWTEVNSWTMYYEGVSSTDGKHRIMQAKSQDHLHWIKAGVVLDPQDDADAWDCGGVGSPHVLRLDDGSLRMYYTGQRLDGSTAIGVARMSLTHECEWNREQATISFAGE